MKRLNIFYLVLIVVLSSCATSNKYMADDIYSVKPNALPLGESSADETSYTAFKQRQEGRSTTRQVFANQMDQDRRMQCFRQRFWTRDCGCSYSEWVMGSPFSSMNQPSFGMWNSPMGWGGNQMGWNQQMGWGGNQMFWGGNQMGWNQQMGWGGNQMFWGGNDMGWNQQMGWGGNQMFWGGNNMGWGGHQNGWGGHNNFSWNGNNANNFQSNHHNGPRGTSSGYANPNGRSYTGTVKSGTISGTNSRDKGNSVNTNSRVVRKPIENVVTVPAARMPGRENVNGAIRGNSGNSTQERTYRSSTEINRNPSSTVNRPSGIPTQGRTINSGSSNTNMRTSPESSPTNRGSSGISSPSSSPGRGGSSPGSTSPSRRP